MSENPTEGIILIAIFMVTREDVLDCANEMGMSEEQVTEDVIEMVREKVKQGLRDQREVVKSIVKEAIKCPLGLVCSPTCPWQEVGGCTFSKGAKRETE
jgi:hypothetical protein